MSQIASGKWGQRTNSADFTDAHMSATPASPSHAVLREGPYTAYSFILWGVLPCLPVLY